MNRLAVLAQPLLEVFAVDESENQYNTVWIHDAVHDPIVADAHSKEAVLGPLDSLHQFAGRSWIRRQGVDSSLYSLAFRSRSQLEGPRGGAGEFNAKAHRTALDSRTLVLSDCHPTLLPLRRSARPRWRSRMNCDAFARIRSSASTVKGSTTATGLPRRVMRKDSPASARSTMSDACVFRSRIPTAAIPQL